jgi:hypothetical protein
MKTSKLLIGCAVGCLCLAILAAGGVFVAYRHYSGFAERVADEFAAPGSPSVRTGSDFLTKEQFATDPRLGEVRDIVIGELDPRPGTEIGIAGTDAALLWAWEGEVLDRDADVIAAVLFEGRASHVDIVDVEGDGVCEFMNRGSWGDDVWLRDHTGADLWVYGGDPGVDDACAGDIDGDGILEFAVGFNGGGGVHLLDARGEVQWQERDSNVWHVEMADANGDGSLEVIHTSSGGALTVRGRDGSVLGKHRGASYLSKFSLCRYPGRSDAQHIVACRDGAIQVLDFEGDTVARLDAPEAGDLGHARATPVKLVADAPEYFAVVVDTGGMKMGYLYVYDGGGSLVYQEVMEGVCAAVAATPADDVGAEALLVGGENRVCRYRAGGAELEE